LTEEVWLNSSGGTNPLAVSGGLVEVTGRGRERS